MRKKNWWVVASAGGIALSVLSLFLPVLSYTTAKGTAHSYNIVNLVTDPESFVRVVFDEYTGTLWIDSSMRTSIGRVILVAAVGVIALVLAATGIVTLSQQRRNVGPFVLAVLGLVGTALPAASLYILPRHHSCRRVCSRDAHCHDSGARGGHVEAAADA